MRLLSRAKFKSVNAAYKRIIHTRFSLTFLGLCIVHCVAQGLFLTFIFRVDKDATDLVAQILQTAEVSRSILPWRVRENGHDILRLCDDIPHMAPYDSCVTIVGSPTQNLSSRAASVPSETGANSISRSLFPRVDPVRISIQASKNESGRVDGVSISDQHSLESVFLSEQCTLTLLYPMQVLNGAKREGIVLLASQFWLLGISLFGVLTGSIPHLLAVFCMRVLANSWSAYTIWRTKDVQLRFQRLLVDAGSPCNYDLFPTYFKTRFALQIPELLFACSASLFTALLGWRLMKVYKAHTFNRVGPPEAIVHMYRYYLAIFVYLHLSVFVVIASAGLWADQLFNSAISALSLHKPLYETLLFFTLITLVPWILLASHAVRREHRGFTVFVLTLCFFYITCWSTMFYSQVYRWTWLQWPFFACATVASLLVLIACGILGIICWLNYDKGLAQYLNAESALAATDFEPEMFANELGSDSGHGHGHSVRDSIAAAAGTQFSLTVDTNWDFKDLKRPPIYLVDMQKDSKFRTMPR